jgi:hypothetical protein
LQQLTKIPEEEQTNLELQMKEPQEFSLKIRHPYWVEKGKLKILVNGKSQKISSSPSGFAEIKRTWKTGDKIVVQLPMKLSVTPLTPAQKFVSFAYGPVILAAKFESSDLKKEDFWHEQDTRGTRKGILQSIPIEKIPVLTGSPEDIVRKTKRVPGKDLSFRTEGLGIPDDYTLIPFNHIHYSRYVLYFPLAQPTDRQKPVDENEPAIENELLKQKTALLEPITIDGVHIGDETSEKDHKMEAVFSETKPSEFDNLSWRHALKGGYFMYNLKSLPDETQSLYLLFRASDDGERTFDLLIDGRLVKTFNHNKPVEGASSTALHSVIVPIPEAFTKGKKDITVKLQAKQGNIAGGIFDLRLIRTADTEAIKN